MIAQHSLLAGINSGGFAMAPPVPSRLQFINVVVASFARMLSARSGHDYDAVLARIMILPNELAELFETPAGWITLAGIIDNDVAFQPAVH